MKVLNQLEHFNFNLSQADALDNDYKSFTEAMGMIVEGSNDEAHIILKSLYKHTQHEEIKKLCSNLIFDYCFSESNWEDFNSLDLQEDENIEAGNRLIGGVSREFPKSEYVFQKQSFILPITLSLSGSPIVEVMINGKVKNFWVDTGAGMTCICSSVANECGINTEQINGLEIGTSTDEQIDSKIALINQLNIGELLIKNQPTLVFDDENLTIPSGSGENMVIEGIIGWDIIKYLYLDINYQDKNLVIQKPEQNSDLRHNLIFCGYPIVKVESEERIPLYFGLDTGANKTLFYKDSLLNKVNNLKVNKKKINAGGIGGSKEVEINQIDQLSVFFNSELLEVEDLRECLTEYATFFKLDGVFGSDIAQKGRLIIDYTNRKIDLKI